MTMKTNTEDKQKFLINCCDGANDIERATVSFVMALASVTNNAETAVFATSDAAGLCVRGGTDELIADGYEPLSGLVDEFVENGGKIWLCPVCAKAKGITSDILRAGVEIAGVPRMMEFIASGARLLA
jgi:predicted peroxiredoxin